MSKVAERLEALVEAAGLDTLDTSTSTRFVAYLELLLRWNECVNLTAIRDEAGILSRHFLESIACARALPSGIGTLLDFGSGAGFPGLPIALCRADIQVTLAESQGKKAAFLREAVRVLGVSATVHAGRAETLGTQYDCVTLRAVDKMHLAVTAAAKLVRSGGWLAPMTSLGDVDALREIVGSDFSWSGSLTLPGGDERILALGQRRPNELS